MPSKLAECTLKLIFHTITRPGRNKYQNRDATWVVYFLHCVREWNNVIIFYCTLKYLRTLLGLFPHPVNRVSFRVVLELGMREGVNVVLRTTVTRRSIRVNLSWKQSWEGTPVAFVYFTRLTSWASLLLVDCCCRTRFIAVLFAKSYPRIICILLHCLRGVRYL